MELKAFEMEKILTLIQYCTRTDRQTDFMCRHRGTFLSACSDARRRRRPILLCFSRRFLFSSFVDYLWCWYPTRPTTNFRWRVQIKRENETKFNASVATLLTSNTHSQAKVNCSSRLPSEEREVPYASNRLPR